MLPLKERVWVNSGSWWWTGRPGVLQFMGSQRVGHNWATELNWIYFHFLYLFIYLIWLHWIFVVACRMFRCGMWTLSCGLWDLVPWLGIELGSPALGAQSLNPWTTREVPHWYIYEIYFWKKLMAKNYIKTCSGAHIFPFASGFKMSLWVTQKL